MTFVLYTKTLKLSQFNNHPMGFMNRTSWQPQSNPTQPLLTLPRSQWDKNQLVPWIELANSGPLWIDIVLNNLDDGGHPFHLHGHDFYVLSTHKSTGGWGSYNPFATTPDTAPEGPYEFSTPVRKDTVFIPRRGYAVIRFLADNEGIWMFHCHVLWHQASGMAMAFQVGGNEDAGVFLADAERRDTAVSLCPV
jgi:FtsP/CotA-like multicopper oxidase with cupredoxin domain